MKPSRAMVASDIWNLVSDRTMCRSVDKLSASPSHSYKCHLSFSYLSLFVGEILDIQSKGKIDHSPTFRGSMSHGSLIAVSSR